MSSQNTVWVWYPGSEIRKKPIPDPGCRGQKGTGSRIRIRNTGLLYPLLYSILNPYLDLVGVGPGNR
jgi:hypothetical protein